MHITQLTSKVLQRQYLTVLLVHNVHCCGTVLQHGTAVVWGILSISIKDGRMPKPCGASISLPNVRKVAHSVNQLFNVSHYFVPGYVPTLGLLFCDWSTISTRPVMTCGGFVCTVLCCAVKIELDLIDIATHGTAPEQVPNTCSMTCIGNRPLLSHCNNRKNKARRHIVKIHHLR